MEMEMDDWDFDSADGIDPLELFILDEYVLKEGEEEANGGGCLAVLAWLIIIPILLMEKLT